MNLEEVESYLRSFTISGDKVLYLLSFFWYYVKEFKSLVRLPETCLLREKQVNEIFYNSWNSTLYFGILYTCGLECFRFFFSLLFFFLFFSFLIRIRSNNDRSRLKYCEHTNFINDIYLKNYITSLALWLGVHVYAPVRPWRTKFDL